MMFDAGGGSYAPPLGAEGALERRAITVAIYDDHVLARTGLAALLGGKKIEVLRSGPVDLHLCGNALVHPAADVTLVAASERGTELARHLSRERQATVLLMMESAFDSAALLAMLTTGAAGAVCRACSSERVIAAIRAAACGDGVSECRHGSVPPPTDEAPVLSERERRVTIELARGLQTEDIAATLCISPHTVRTHVRNLKRKLGARTSAQAVALAIANGAVDPSAPV